MYFGMKNILKNNRNHTSKQPQRPTRIDNMKEISRLVYYLFKYKNRLWINIIKTD
jgi:hypothetical protein